jgi:glycosyltransferase involved in cell wall biosynthesis
MKFPIISIVIATYNSEKTLEISLKSLRKQSYPKEKLEILVIDGGSEDSTLIIAKKYGCKIIFNPQREPIAAKHIGFLRAKGKYIVYFDSDEEMQNPQSLKIKYLAFLKNPSIKAVIPSGYKNPKGYAPINYYINEFGDPFSFFIYRISKSAEYFIKHMKDYYKKVSEDKDSVVFDLREVKLLPLIELVASGSMVDLEYLRFSSPEIKKDPTLIPFFFYLLNKKGGLLAITKKDYIVHYSSDTLRRYLKKINSRIKNNIYLTTMGAGGFLGREQFQPESFRLKKYLFIPYALSILPCLIDSFYLFLTRKRSIYLIHAPLCIYTASLTIYYYLLKSLGLKPTIKSYGN